MRSEIERIFKGIILVTLAQLVACSSQFKEDNKMWKKTYKEGLAYEYYYRNLARRGFKAHLDNTTEDYEVTVWKIYAELEDISFQIMAPLRNKYHIDTSTGVSTHVSAWLLSKGMAWFPKATASAAETSARSFIVNLHSIKTMGPEQDQETLKFMVEHEIMLADFLKLYSEGENESAKRIFSDKIIDYRNKMKN